MIKFLAFLLIVLLCSTPVFASEDVFEKVADKYYSEGNKIIEEEKDFMGNYDGFLHTQHRIKYSLAKLVNVNIMS